jgi:hypothetical protein
VSQSTFNKERARKLKSQRKRARKEQRRKAKKQEIKRHEPPSGVIRQPRLQVELGRGRIGWGQVAGTEQTETECADTPA